MSGSLAQNYAKGGFGLSLRPGDRPALLIVDFVRAYLVPESPLYAAAEPARAATETLLAASRGAGIPIVHTGVRYQPGGRDGGVFFRKVPALACFEDGVRPDLAAFAAGLEPGPGETVILKQYASAFFGTTLAPTLMAARMSCLPISLPATLFGRTRASLITRSANEAVRSTMSVGPFAGA